MGTPKKCFINVFFNEGVEAEEFNTPESTMEALKDFYKSKDPVDKGDPYIDVSEHEAGDRYVQFLMYSDRDVNLDFQVELLEEYLNDRYPDQVEEVTLDSWIQADYP
jgi:hypothetical protein